MALLIKVTTDNRNRTASEVRHRLSKHGGSLGETGCVAWLFDEKGLIFVGRSKELTEEDLLMSVLESDAEDVRETEDGFEITTAPDELGRVKADLETQGIPVEEAELTFLPQTTVSLVGEEARRILRLITSLEELDDVEAVYTNSDIPPEVMEEATAR